MTGFDKTWLRRTELATLRDMAILSINFIIAPWWIVLKK